MKKIILSFFLLAGLLVYGQQPLSNYKSANDLDIAVPYTKKDLTGSERTTAPVMNKQTSVLAATGIGSSIYDLQTNASVDNRIHYDTTTGEVGAAWTLSLTNDPFNDRGTGYNFRGNSGWSSSPTSRIENVRVGWPSLLRTASSEVVLSHTVNNDFNLERRTTTGSGSWTSSNLTNLTDGVLWPRAAVGGANNETIHAIALSTPVANDGSVYKGLDGALLYYRSTDGGVNWDIQDSLLPFQDTASFYGFGGDSYAIDAQGNTVVIAVFNDFDPSFILKSTDGGDNWTQTIFLDNNLYDYDATAAGSISDNNNDNIPDTITTTDNSGAVILDQNGDAHVFFGRMRILDDEPTLDSNSSYFPATDGLVYWSETSPTPTVIASAPDLNLDGTLGITSINDIATYFTSLVSFPNAGISSEGDLFLAFSGFYELETSTSGQFYRHIFLIYSEDGGNTWTPDPIDISSADFSQLESVFPSVARTVDDSIRVVFQVDAEPGLHVRGDEDASGQNDIVYLSFPNYARGIGLNEEKNLNPLKAIFPNPAANQINIQLNITEPGDYQVALVDATGKTVMNTSLGMLQQGLNRETIDISHLPKGMYVLNLTSESSSFTDRFIKK